MRSSQHRASGEENERFLGAVTVGKPNREGYSNVSRDTLCVQVAGILTGDVPLLGTALGLETVVEGARGPIIPGFAAVKAAAGAAGAFGCTISGAGPTVVAVVDDKAVGERVAKAMSEAFEAEGGLRTNSIQIVQLDREGAREVHAPPR